MSNVVELSGNAFERGAGQAAACPDSVGDVRRAVEGRLAAASHLLEDRRTSGFLASLHSYLAQNDPDGLLELSGIAEGFAIPSDDLFAYLHLSVLADISLADGCSAWAVRHPFHRAMIGKNRDFRGEHLRIQRVFRHRDPAWDRRVVTCVGSLGSPGAYSSGVNSDGLALVDTQVRTSDHGVGILRYFLMTRLLVRCATVAEALAEIEVLDHAGGGTLVLADRSGAMAAVELGHSVVSVEHGTDGWVARTNHFVSPELAAANLRDPSDLAAASSQPRLARLCRWLVGAGPSLTLGDARVEMASHDGSNEAGLCRHGEEGDAQTISGAVFTTNSPTLYFCPARPCSADWRTVDAR
ncbi:MAG: C45 family autoproteolytic acyltransferase/hydrolase [Propylenella sp.]